ncbi:hypothetical protein MPTK1_2g14610 [Marchantia polymorpha subsp. ruderalis]|uniref:Uncharacterized protein n=1 Tax=Marchantia polymorpha TaxID=3197 RepID=A0A2R6X1R3_MARPO|nr:hypothetical protein MARPO_0042s0083 [Marchantia polymorpha]BBN02353.1 hypothetical protein Mp_2g14610 [Marchantia polymorpha subsp. ruderalis]|eukprot:PTQ40048.1 hypothetical protein MARPO_0042s0083 [Marchantia polymorpha]
MASHIVASNPTIDLCGGQIGTGCPPCFVEKCPNFINPRLLKQSVQGQPTARVSHFCLHELFTAHILHPEEFLPLAISSTVARNSEEDRFSLLSTSYWKSRAAADRWTR